MVWSRYVGLLWGIRSHTLSQAIFFQRGWSEKLAFTPNPSALVAITSPGPPPSATSPAIHHRLPARPSTIGYNLPLLPALSGSLPTATRYTRASSFIKMPAMSDHELLKKANKKISDLKEDIRRLSDALQNKDSLLSSYASRVPLLSSFMAAEHSKKLASQSAALQDTVLWDPLTCPRPSCSTPNPEQTWAEVVVRGRRKDLDKSDSPPRLSLSNRYTALTDDNPVHPVDDPAPPLPRDTSAAQMQESAGVVRVAEHPTGGTAQQLPARTSTSSVRRRILKQAVFRRSGGLPRPDPAENQPPSSSTAGPPDPPAPPAALANPPHSLARLHPPSPRPLFNPTTLLVGDSIFRNVRFFNATTRCFPGATVKDILGELPGIMRSLPPSVVRVVVHVGCNDTARQRSELTKADFNELFRFLQDCGLSVFISGFQLWHTAAQVASADSFNLALGFNPPAPPSNLVLSTILTCSGTVTPVLDRMDYIQTSLAARF